MFLCKVVDEFRDEGKWIFIGNCPLVQVSVVLYWVKLAIFLLDQEEATSIWRFRAMNLLKT